MTHSRSNLKVKENKLNSDICFEIWGDRALFALPESSTERVTSEVPTPSAMRGCAEAIYCKPTEFYYQIVGIEVIKKGHLITNTKNNLKEKAKYDKRINTVSPIYTVGESRTSGGRTRRTYVYLSDVRYRVYANIVLRNGIRGNISKQTIINQFKQRMLKGKCFKQPYLGQRDCIAFFSEPTDLEPIHESKNYGMMLYDVFDIRKNIPLNTDETMRSNTVNVMSYICDMQDGFIRVPEINSGEVYRRV